MCLIINNENGKEIHPEIIRSAIRRNPHGFGCVDLETMEVSRSVNMTDAVDRLTTPGRYVAHLRYATHGKVNTGNVHPFEFRNGQFLLMMNGTISGFRDTGAESEESDTAKLSQALDHVKVKDLRQFLSFFKARFLLINRQTGSVQEIGDWHTFHGIGYSKPVNFNYGKKNAPTDSAKRKPTANRMVRKSA